MKRIKTYFAECQRKTLDKTLYADCLQGDARQRILKKIKTIFVEFLSVDTRIQNTRQSIF
jgi:hypothetical protein